MGPTTLPAGANRFRWCGADPPGLAGSPWTRSSRTRASTHSARRTAPGTGICALAMQGNAAVRNVCLKFDRIAVSVRSSSTQRRGKRYADFRRKRAFAWGDARRRRWCLGTTPERGGRIKLSSLLQSPNPSKSPLRRGTSAKRYREPHSRSSEWPGSADWREPAESLRAHRCEATDR